MKKIEEKFNKGFFYKIDKIAPAYINTKNPKYLERDNVFYSGIIFVNYNIDKCFACMYAYTPCACLVPVETRRGHQIPWNWSYRCS